MAKTLILNMERLEKSCCYLTRFSLGVGWLVLWSNDVDFDDFYLRFSLETDQDFNYVVRCRIVRPIQLTPEH